MSTPSSVIADRLDKEMSSWSAIEFVQHQSFVRKKDPSDDKMFKGTTEQIRYIETGLHERLYDWKGYNPLLNTTSISIDYCDGKLAANLYRRDDKRTDDDQVIIKQVFGNEQNGSSHRPFPFNSLFVGDQQLGKAISRAAPLGPVTYLNRDCQRFHFAKGSRGGLAMDYYYDLDPDTSFPLRIQGFSSEQARVAHHEDFEWSTEEELTRIEGHPVAMHSKVVRYDYPSSGKSIVFTTDIVVDKVIFNKNDYPKETFWPSDFSNKKFFDTVKGVAAVPQSKSATQTSTGSGIRADVNEFPSFATGVTFGVVLTLVVTFAALVAKFKSWL